MLRGIRIGARTVWLAGFTGLLALAAAPTPAAAVVSDNFYKQNHPKLLFKKSTLRALRDRIEAGGRDTDAYNFIRFQVDNIFSTWSVGARAWNDFGSTTVPMIGIGTWIPKGEDGNSRDMGRDLILHIVNTYDVDFDEASSAFRLRALALGYDMFFEKTDDVVRAQVRDEMVAYMQTMAYSFPYLVFMHRPYLANHSAMLAGALGLAAICLDGEVDPVLVDDSMARADAIVDSLLAYQYDAGGSYNEGALYATWSMRHLVYYFHAREAHDGFRYADHPKIRALERWLAYEVLPEGLARINNINDSSYSNFPLSLNNTYFDWALSEWNSGLSAWIWEHTSGTYGVDMGLSADKVATVLWHRPVATLQPDAVLPPANLWEGRGLYTYRSGWQSVASSEDIAFTFYSGRFHGGHAQEDQNQFTLRGYGGSFAIDHGPGTTAKQSEAHNIVLIDGVGQHNTGFSVGTDGRISEFLMNDFADYVQGDASAAYTTHSEFNDPDRPFPGIDWSWGYDGGNPVNRALRSVLTVHGSDAPSYFVIMDDIDKDGLLHTYQWRMHTLDLNTVDIGAGPVRISSGASYLDIYPAESSLGPPGVNVAPFANGTADPDSRVLTFTRVAVNPHFAFILIPGSTGTTTAQVARAAYPWGSVAVIDWGGGVADCFVHNPLGALVSVDLTDLRRRRTHRDPFEEPRLGPGSGEGRVTTDAIFTLIRFGESGPQKYLASNVSVLSLDNTDWVKILDGKTSCASNGVTIDIDRNNAVFAFYGPSVNQVEHRDQALPSTRVGNFLMSPGAAASGVAPVPREIRASVSPNPFNPTTRLTLELENRAPVRVAIYDVQGRLVKHLVREVLAAGRHVVEWDATAASGNPVVSGIYFMRVETGNRSRNLKLTVLK